MLNSGSGQNYQPAGRTPIDTLNGGCNISQIPNRTNVFLASRIVTSNAKLEKWLLLLAGSLP
jgi:hypothetical protein